MKTKDYIQQYQPILFETFRLAMEKDRLAHAYLLDGEPGTPLLKIAKYLAKSIVCDCNNGAGCEECKSCRRIEAETYLDLKIIDGAKSGNIKKEEIVNLVNAFSMTAIESKGIQIYIINLAEIMRPEDEAVHALLKFLEEPHANIYAILTTNNIERVIPTIVSRCQVLQIRLRDRASVIDETLSLGVNPKNAQLLSKLYNDPLEIIDVLNNDKTSKIIVVFEGFLDAMKKGKKEAIFYNQKEIVSVIKDKESARFYLDLLSEVFHEIINIKNNIRRYLVNYDKILEGLTPLFDKPEEGLYLILEARSKIEVNVTLPLILDHLTINLMKGNS